MRSMAGITASVSLHGDETIEKVPPWIPAKSIKSSISLSISAAKVFGDPSGRFCESAKRVSVSGNQFALPVLDLRQCAEAINLQLIDELIGVEGFRTAGKPHGAEVSGQHSWIIAGLR